MNKRIKKHLPLSIIVILALLFSGCSTKQIDEYEEILRNAVAATSDLSAYDEHKESYGNTQNADYFYSGNNGNADAYIGTADTSDADASETAVTLSLYDGTVVSIPAWDGYPYLILKNNEPGFSDDEKITASTELYNSLDSLGRCTYAFANIGTDLMPKEDRGSIGSVRPTGWQTVKYEGIDGNYLYNRCHLIGYQLTAENANEQNLVTGTRYMNVEGMLPFENLVASYIRATKNHVLYRVTPLFDGNNMVCHGVEMEALSVEDNGEGISFHVYCYNYQPGITIDYTDGSSVQTGSTTFTSPAFDGSLFSLYGISTEDSEVTYVLNINSMKFHLPTCSSVQQMSSRNKQVTTMSRDELIAAGYEACGSCHP